MTRRLLNGYSTQTYKNEVFGAQWVNSEFGRFEFEVPKNLW